jgi:threonyl-tRNA synthetase
MTMNDAHLYLRPAQIKDEFIGVLKMFDEVYKKIGIRDYWFRLSLPDFKANPDKYTGDPKAWEHAAIEIKKAMKEWGHKFVEGVGEAAFYGPKIDVQVKNAHGKEETIATCQIDIVIPSRLNLHYIDEQGKEETPVVLHRAILGTFDRFTGFLLEQTEGKLPLWLSPRQVRILNFTDRNAKAAQKLYNELKEAIPHLNVDLDLRTETVQVRDAEMLKINYIVVIGDKEEDNKTLAVRPRGEKPKFGVKHTAFIEQLKKELA